MKKNYFIFGIIGLLACVKVNAEVCPFETQVAINNDAGSVSVSVREKSWVICRRGSPVPFCA